MNKLNELLEIMKEHQKFDRLVQGYWLRAEKVHGDYLGCFFGCAMQTSDDAIEKACEMYDLPLWIGYWSESVFEELKPEDAVKWPVQLLESLVNFKGDTEKLRHDLAIKRLTNLLPTKNEEVDSAIALVIAYHKNPDEQKRIAAKSAADSAADSAWSAHPAWSVAKSAAKSAAWSVAKSADSATWSTAWSTAWSSEKDWMLGLLREKS